MAAIQVLTAPTHTQTPGSALGEKKWYKSINIYMSQPAESEGKSAKNLS